jgi:hypothetical protein
MKMLAFGSALGASSDCAVAIADMAKTLAKTRLALKRRAKAAVGRGGA